MKKLNRLFLSIYFLINLVVLFSSLKKLTAVRQIILRYVTAPYYEKPIALIFNPKSMKHEEKFLSAGNGSLCRICIMQKGSSHH